MNAIAFNDRRKLRDAVMAYMNGTIKTYAFDDMNCECMDSRDQSVRQISKLLYKIHDDTVDHPISVTPATWHTLIRIAAFLDTEFAADVQPKKDNWPFTDVGEWQILQTKIDGIEFPSYDPAIHAMPVHGPLNRIPALVGIGIIVLVFALLVVVLIATQ